MSTLTCLVDDSDCVPYGQLQRDLCIVHYRWLMAYGTTDRAKQPIDHNKVVDRGVEMLARRCRQGLEPAEALPRFARDQLVHELWCQGWTDVEIATWTRMSTYTTARIRERLGLAANVLRGAVA